MKNQDVFQWLNRAVSKNQEVLQWFFYFGALACIGSRYGRLALGLVILLGIPWCVALAWKHEKSRNKV